MHVSIHILALVGGLASSVLAKAPLSDQVRTETAAPQEIGTMTTDGMLVYSLNYCTIVQTTSCGISLSTGVPIPTYYSSPAVPTNPNPTNTDYLPPPGQSEFTSSDSGYRTVTDDNSSQVVTATDSNGHTTVLTSKIHPTSSGGSDGTATGTETPVEPPSSGTMTHTSNPTATGTETGTPTAGAGGLVPAIGLAGLLAAAVVI